MRPSRTVLHLLSLVLLFSGVAAADPLPVQADRIVDYSISVRLDAVKKQLEGTERITWRNPSKEPVSDLWFHLYLNGFKNTRSTFMKESGGQLRGDRMSDNHWGWTDITAIRVADGPDLMQAMRFEHPDDDNAEDQTVVRVALPSPVPPGGTITVELSFHAQLPEVFARSGYKRDYFLVGQWFPKLGVYEPAGMRGRAAGGWNCHQYHANSEFYADYGVFHVDITVPSRFVVGATGVAKGRVVNSDGAITYFYEQADVHDFAWTADPSFIRVRRTFTPAREVTPAEYAATAARLGRTLEEVKLSDVEIIVLMQPAHMPQLEEHVKAAKAGLKYFGLWYGRYPYKTLTVVDPPQDASGSAGMEYPTFITAGTSYLANYPPMNGMHGVAEVTVHEFGHQYWYGMVGNNEFEEAWLDEGVNTYSTGLVMEQIYGVDESMGNLLGLKIGELDSIQAAITSDKRDVIQKPAWGYAGDYSYYAYLKPSAVLRTLHRMLGDETMGRVMRTYHERWRFRHPAATDFFAVASEVSGRDLTSFFQQAILGGQVLDYAVDAVSTQPAGTPRGVFEKNGKRETLSDTAKTDDKATKDNKGPYESRVLVRRLGDFVVPVEIALKFEGKPVERVRWDGRDAFKRLVIVRPEKLEWASVDPDHSLLIDANWLNNSRRVQPDTRAASRWTTRALAWLQELFALAAF